MRKLFNKPPSFKKQQHNSHKVDNTVDILQELLLNSDAKINSFLEMLQREYPEKFKLLFEESSSVSTNQIVSESHESDDFFDVWQRIEKSISNEELTGKMKKINDNIK